MSTDIERLRKALADRYRIERELGAGGMATVYLAEDLKHHRKVAVKVLRPDLAATLGADRFVREIEVAAQLHHPHVLPLYDSGEADGFLFYVMPYEEGHSLRERLDKEGELPIRDAVRLLHNIADALAHAHQHGLVHRDIKPENVMLSGRHALVTDFGVAKAVSEATGRQKLTTIGVALGTPTYMAPEQAVADPHIDHRADIYALGILAYELVTGRPPFTGMTPQAILAAQVTQAPTPVAVQRPTVPPVLASLIMRCLEKKPADRFQSVEEMLPILEALATPSGGTTPLDTAPYVAVVRGTRRRTWYVVGGAALVAALAWVGWRAMALDPLDIEFANIRQVTRESETEINVAISPDGREVAYAAGHAGRTRLVVRDVSGGRPVELTADWGGAQSFPQWLPDGRSIVFSTDGRSRGHQAGGWKIPRLGGQAVRPDSSDQAALAAGQAITQRADSAFSRRSDGSEQLIAVGQQVHSPAWRADGSAVAFVSGNSESLTTWGNIAPSEIWVTPAGGVPVRVTDGASLNVSPAWLPDGTLLFVSNRDGARDIYAVRLDRTGAPRERPTRLTTGLDANSISVSADGRAVAYERFILRRNIYSLPIPRSGSASIRESRAVTSGNQTIENLDVSADGTSIVFDSNLEGDQNIYLMPATGGEPRRVTRDPGDEFSPDLSADGGEITFHTTRNATRDIYVINADGSGEQRLTSDDGESFQPAWSPDGLSIAYGDITSTGSRVMVVRRGARGEPWSEAEPIEAGRGFAPRWSPDGTKIVFDLRFAPGGLGVHTIGGASRDLLLDRSTTRGPYSGPEWSADGSRIYFRAFSPEGVEGVYEVAATGGTPRLLVRFDEPGMSVYPAPVLAERGRFYFAVGQIESDIYVMDLVRK